MEKPAGYEGFYGFDERPFTLDTDPRFLYHSEAHDRAAQAMLDAIRRRDGIVMLTGELGMGKTTLCRAVMEQLDRRTLTSLVAAPFVAPEDLLRTVLVDFGVISQADRSVGPLAQASLADLSAALRDFLCSLAPLQAFAVVIIDEAQSLSVDLLKQIVVVADTRGDEQLLQLMLVGQPALAAALLKQGMRQLFQRVSARATLGPLREDEIFGYVTHRLQVAGPSARVEFDAGALEQLHALSRGVPRVVTLLCDRALTAGAQESASTIDERLVRAAAEDLDLAPRVSKTAAAARTAAMAAGFALLMLLGSAAGAFVFRSNVEALVEQWQAPPAPPPAPQPAVAPTIVAPPAPADVTRGQTPL
jgi:general secretion pathway protein A